MSAEMLSTPFMLVFMAPFFMVNIEGIIGKIGEILPTGAMMTIFAHFSANSVSLSSIAVPSITIFVWIILSFVIFNFTYKKVGVDN